ncbi:M23 family metallopeptidase [Microlunatus parietis]|uniref:Murein DD-endopeptidase MepM/ murein hydrolase activator NlpD n=1 Tax=Microlunatus parietis TaxID=682979 RepID=A0A7Y9LDM5_9ACTN|nr:M23 family metallopeptidase [Microlunatus parietis]NYE72106.1 murein DD-endopeptidase MepM/ murein hydrolase activator NlpD [Microlunatus parietis]
MLKKLFIAALALLFLAPMLALVSVGVLTNPAANAACTVGGGGIVVRNVPDSLAATTADGTRFTLNRKQLTHAATIIEIGNRIDGVGRPGIQIALMAALTESTLRQLANTGAYPESGSYPNDGNGSDHDSLGLFQMRPAAGWGTVAELMDPTYQAKAFFGGPTGPNHPSPRGLLDIPGWQDMDPGEAAQAVEVSAYPDRYRNYEPVAATILNTLTRTGTGSGGPAGTLPESSRVVFPLPEGTWVRASGFGMRVHPVTGEYKMHTGVDFAAPNGTPILAVADGTVTVAGASGGYGNLIVVEHTIGGRTVATAYAHMWDHGIHVAAGDQVTAGQHIGDVGSSGHSTGTHLHFEVRPGGTNAAAIDPEPWLNTHGAAKLPTPETGGPDGCNPATGLAPDTPPAPFQGSDPDRLVDDPTSNGQITARTAHILAEIRAAFPDTSWACWSPRPGTASEHPLGRACDGTFGNAIGQAATGDALELGWAVTNWLKEHAEILGIEYLIWQQRIWSLARADEGWRPYDGGGMHDPGSVTGGHLDHLHWTARSGG